MKKQYVKYSHRQVVRKGKKDGRDWKWKFWPFVKVPKPQEPRTDQTELAPFEQEIIQAGEQEISRLVEAWKQLDEKLKPRYCKALAALKAAEKRDAKESNEAEEARREFQVAEAKYKELDLPPLSPQWRNFWLFLIAVAEFPLNSIVFALFGAGQVETYIMAGALCVGIPIIAHFFGQAIRQDHKSKTDIALIIAMPTTMLFILGAIAFIRAKYFEAMQNYKILGVTLTPFQMTVLFIIINFAIFLVAVIVSYEGSHPNKQLYHTVIARYKEALRRLKKEATEAEASGKELERAEIAFQQIRNRRHKCHEQFFQKAKTVQQTAEWLAAAYRAANLRVRSDFPECFKGDPPSPEIPETLANMDWECKDVVAEIREGRVA